MTDLLRSKVERATRIEDPYREHAAHQSMSAYLDDWEAAYVLLGRRILALRQMRDRRRSDALAGVWPPSPGASSKHYLRPNALSNHCVCGFMTTREDVWQRHLAEASTN